MRNNEIRLVDKYSFRVEALWNGGVNLDPNNFTRKGEPSYEGKNRKISHN